MPSVAKDRRFRQNGDQRSRQIAEFLIDRQARNQTPATLDWYRRCLRDWAAFESLTHTLALVTDADESTAMIQWLIPLMYQRTAQSADSPHLFLDDLLNLLSKRPE